MSVKCDFFGTTDLGREREINQDRILVARLEEPAADLLVVADGMGGAAAGDRAAECVVQTIAQQITEDLDVSEPFEFLELLVATAQDALEKEVASEPELESMGTTLTMAYCHWPDLYVVHVGDSRCYLLRHETLSRVTNDHTVAQKFVEEGVISEEEADGSPLEHQLWNVITSERAIKPERHLSSLSIGDEILLCSDGLTKHVDDQQIADTIQNAASAQEACQKLIEMANQDGGTDNIAVIVGTFKKE